MTNPIRQHSLTLLLCCIVCTTQAQMTAHEVLQKSIQTHDPLQRWQQLKMNADMSIVRTQHPDRRFSLELNLPQQLFSYRVQKDSVEYMQGFRNDTLLIAIGGNNAPSEADIQKHELTRARTQYLREVYEYLLLLPMRLQNDTAWLSDTYTIEKFNYSDCYKLTIQYEPVNENETWHFFIEQQTFLLKGYQFYLRDKSLDGEYIYLEDYVLFDHLLMPKTKRWFWNKDNVFFRTDRILRFY